MLLGPHWPQLRDMIKVAFAKAREPLPKKLCCKTAANGGESGVKRRKQLPIMVARGKIYHYLHSPHSYVDL